MQTQETAPSMANTLAETTLFQSLDYSCSQQKRPSAAYLTLCNLITIRQTKATDAHHPKNDAQVRYLPAFVCRWNSPRLPTPEGQQWPLDGQICPNFSMDHNPATFRRDKVLSDRRVCKHRIAATSTKASTQEIMHAAVSLMKCARSHFVTTDLYSNRQFLQPHLLLPLLIDLPLCVDPPVDLRVNRLSVRSVCAGGALLSGDRYRAFMISEVRSTPDYIMFFFFDDGISSRQLPNGFRWTPLGSVFSVSALRHARCLFAVFLGSSGLVGC